MNDPFDVEPCDCGASQVDAASDWAKEEPAVRALELRAAQRERQAAGDPE